MNFDKYVEETFLSEQELIENSTKTRGINSLKAKVDALYASTSNARILSKVASIYMLLEDAYNISMYKFQYKAFILSMTKEIQTLNEYLEIVGDE